MRLIRPFLFLCLLALGATAHAHDPGLSSVMLELHHDRIEAVITFSGIDAPWLVPDFNSSSSASAVRDRITDELTRQSGSLWRLRSEKVELALHSTQVTWAAGNNVVCTQSYDRPTGGRLHFASAVFELLPPGHRQHVSVVAEDGRLLFDQLLGKDEAEIETPLPPLSPSPSVQSASLPVKVSFIAFLRLGIEHIITGYDHLLFLFAFLITARSLRTVLKIVTSFTLAHSLTLALSALNLVSVPSRWVEPLIAGTIVFVAVQNLLRPEGSTERVKLTFAFGLIHGFGFASVLREMGIASLGTSAWRALAGFNLGVELGQIAVASVILPLLWALRSWKGDEQRWPRAASAMIALAGGYWLVQRVVWA